MRNASLDAAPPNAVFEEMINSRSDRPTDAQDLEALWDVARPREGEAFLRRLLADVEIGAQDRSSARSIEILTQIARAEGLQGKVVEADHTLCAAEKALGVTPALSPKLRVLLERGRLLVRAKIPAQASTRFLEVISLARDSPADTCHAIDAAHMLSTIETPKRRHEWTLKAIELAENSREARARAWRGILYVSLGWHFLDLLQFSRAIAAFERAVDCFVEQDASVNATLARSYGGRALRLMHRFDEALRTQQAALAELSRAGVDDGAVVEELAECLHALGRSGEAEVLFARAYDLLTREASFREREPARLGRLKRLGKVEARD